MLIRHSYQLNVGGILDESNTVSHVVLNDLVGTKVQNAGDALKVNLDKALTFSPELSNLKVDLVAAGVAADDPAATDGTVNYHFTAAGIKKVNDAAVAAGYTTENLDQVVGTVTVSKDSTPVVTDPTDPTDPTKPATSTESEFTINLIDEKGHTVQVVQPATGKVGHVIDYSQVPYEITHDGVTYKLISHGVTVPVDGGEANVYYAITEEQAPTAVKDPSTGDITLTIPGVGTFTIPKGGEVTLPDGSEAKDNVDGTVTITSPEGDTTVVNVTEAPKTSTTDTDGDGLDDATEDKIGTDKNKPDTDGDGETDLQELLNGTDPKDATDNSKTTKDPNAPTADKVTDKDGNVTVVVHVPGHGDISIPLDKDGNGSGTLPDGTKVEIKGGTITITPVDKDGKTENPVIILVPGTDSSADSTKDTDGDGLTDGTEKEIGTNPNEVDTDKDGLTDKEELEKGTDPRVSDTDKDGLNDSEDSDPLDASKPGKDANGTVTNGSTENTFVINWPDGTSTEVKPGDTGKTPDGDNYVVNPDGSVTVYEGDTTTVKYVIPAPGTSTSADDAKDTDGDGLSDGTEKEIGTNPNEKDTDKDGLTDKEELEKGTDPRKNDTDGDGIDDKTDTAPLDKSNGGSTTTTPATDQAIKDLLDTIKDLADKLAAGNSDGNNSTDATDLKAIIDKLIAELTAKGDIDPATQSVIDRLLVLLDKVQNGETVTTPTGDKELQDLINKLTDTLGKLGDKDSTNDTTSLDGLTDLLNSILTKLGDTNPGATSAIEKLIESLKEGSTIDGDLLAQLLKAITDLSNADNADNPTSDQLKDLINNIVNNLPKGEDGKIDKSIQDLIDQIKALQDIVDRLTADKDKVVDGDGNVDPDVSKDILAIIKELVDSGKVPAGSDLEKLIQELLENLGANDPAVENLLKEIEKLYNDKYTDGTNTTADNSNLEKILQDLKDSLTKGEDGNVIPELKDYSDLIQSLINQLKNNQGVPSDLLTKITELLTKVDAGETPAATDVQGLIDALKEFGKDFTGTDKTDLDSLIALLTKLADGTATDAEKDSLGDVLNKFITNNEATLPSDFADTLKELLEKFNSNDSTLLPGLIQQILDKLNKDNSDTTSTDPSDHGDLAQLLKDLLDKVSTGTADKDDVAKQLADILKLLGTDNTKEIQDLIDQLTKQLGGDSTINNYYGDTYIYNYGANPGVATDVNINGKDGADGTVHIDKDGTVTVNIPGQDPKELKPGESVTTPGGYTVTNNNGTITITKNGKDGSNGTDGKDGNGGANETDQNTSDYDKGVTDGENDAKNGKTPSDLTGRSQEYREGYQYAYNKVRLAQANAESNETDEDTLPQTGEENSDATKVAGILAAGLGLLGLAGIRKRKED